MLNLELALLSNCQHYTFIKMYKNVSENLVLFCVVL